MKTSARGKHSSLFAKIASRNNGFITLIHGSTQIDSNHTKILMINTEMIRNQDEKLFGPFHVMLKLAYRGLL